MNLDRFDSPDWRERRAAIIALREANPQELPGQLLEVIRANHRNLGALNAALDLLSGLRDDVLPGLLQLLQDPQAEVRAYALTALAQQRWPEAVPEIIRCLEDPDPNVRFNAVECLGNMQVLNAIDPLLRILHDRDFYLSFAALEALVKIGTSGVVDEIASLTTDETLGSAAIEALGMLGGLSAVPSILNWLESPLGEAGPVAMALVEVHRRQGSNALYKQVIPFAVAEAIGRAGQEKLLTALGAAVRKAATISFSPALPALAAVSGWLLGHPHNSQNPEARAEFISGARLLLAQMLSYAKLRETALEALKQNGREAIPSLVSKLDDPDLETRRAALAALGSIGDRSAVPVLIQALETEDGDLPAVAAGALGKIGDRAAFDALCRQFDHPSALIRQSAIAAINSLGHPEHTPRMIKVAQSSDAPAREAAIRSLGYFGDMQGLDTILQACQDHAIGVRQAAIESLSMYEDERIPGIIQTASQDPIPAIRSAAARTLRFSPAAFALPLLAMLLSDSDMWVRIYACRSLAQFRDPATVSALADLLNDPVPPVRAAAAEALGIIGGKDAVSALVRLLNDSEIAVVQKAIHALAATHQPGAIPALVRFISTAGETIKSSAINALGEHGSPEATDALRHIAASGEEADLALQALMQIRSPEAVQAVVDALPFASSRKTIIEAVSSLGEDALPEIVRLLQRPDSTVEMRLAIVDGLQRVSSIQKTGILIDLLKDPDERVRQTAAYALGEVGSSAARPALSQLAQDDPDEQTRQRVRMALKKLL